MNVLALVEIDRRIELLEWVKRRSLARLQSGPLSELPTEILTPLIAEFAAPFNEALGTLEALRLRETRRLIPLN